VKNMVKIETSVNSLCIIEDCTTHHIPMDVETAEAMVPVLKKYIDKNKKRFVREGMEFIDNKQNGKVFFKVETGHLYSWELDILCDFMNGLREAD
jgi:hypothetical protein